MSNDQVNEAGAGADAAAGPAAKGAAKGAAAAPAGGKKEKPQPVGVVVMPRAVMVEGKLVPEK